MAADDERRWRRIYALVIVTLATLVGVFSWVSVRYR
jgi:hypothetical protein